jgi:predicted nucleotide-binding protein
MVLQRFLEKKLKLETDEFDAVPAAGYHASERLQEMLDNACFAFIVMTGEDEVGDKLRARQNVIHEIGLFQGRLGIKRAIVLLEEGCEQFSNISGLIYIPFPKGNIEAATERVRGVLERERIVE